jgi:hypothetical protein
VQLSCLWSWGGDGTSGRTGGQLELIPRLGWLTVLVRAPSRWLDELESLMAVHLFALSFQRWRREMVQVMTTYFGLSTSVSVTSAPCLELKVKAQPSPLPLSRRPRGGDKRRQRANRQSAACYRLKSDGSNPFVSPSAGDQARLETRSRSVPSSATRSSLETTLIRRRWTCNWLHPQPSVPVLSSLQVPCFSRMGYPALMHVWCVGATRGAALPSLRPS